VASARRGENKMAARRKWQWRQYEKISKAMKGIYKMAKMKASKKKMAAKMAKK
jgi:hypothetical protein